MHAHAYTHRSKPAETNMFARSDYVRFLYFSMSSIFRRGAVLIPEHIRDDSVCSYPLEKRLLVDDALIHTNGTYVVVN